MSAPAAARPERFLPPHAPGMRIGLFGGTFDPPHLAHLGASLLALKRLKLDRVWWLVTPGNPLKNTRGLAPLASRIAAARNVRIDAAVTHELLATPCAPRLQDRVAEAIAATGMPVHRLASGAGHAPRSATTRDHSRRLAAASASATFERSIALRAPLATRSSSSRTCARMRPRNALSSCFSSVPSWETTSSAVLPAKLRRRRE